MKVKCARGPLHEAFQLALTVVPQRSTIPAVTNVKLSAAAKQKPHPARYPAALPDFFIRLLTDEEDVVLDPLRSISNFFKR